MATTTKKQKEKPKQSSEKPKQSNGKPEKLSFQFLYQQRIWSRLVAIIGVIVYIWYTSKDGKVTTLGKQKEVLQQRGQSFVCDQNYLNEIKEFPGCEPKKCGRYISDKIVTANEAEALLKIAKRGMALGGSDGGASILDLHSGALSLGEKFINIYSLDESKKIFNAADLVAYKVIKTKIQHSIAETFQINPDKLYLTHPTFFSRLTDLDPKTVHDEYWHIHVDKDVYESFHYTSLLYLSDYGREFDGGRLIFVESPKNNVTLEPRKGRVAIFTSGSENTHFVERVKSGTRFAITVSFTCDISKSIDDPIIPKG